MGKHIKVTWVHVHTPYILSYAYVHKEITSSYLNLWCLYENTRSCSFTPVLFGVAYSTGKRITSQQIAEHHKMLHITLRNVIPRGYWPNSIKDVVSSVHSISYLYSPVYSHGRKFTLLLLTDKICTQSQAEVEFLLLPTNELCITSLFKKHINVLRPLHSRISTIYHDSFTEVKDKWTQISAAVSAWWWQTASSRVTQTHFPSSFGDPKAFVVLQTCCSMYNGYSRIRSTGD